jgi:hypothetical protein
LKSVLSEWLYVGLVDIIFSFIDVRQYAKYVIIEDKYDEFSIFEITKEKANQMIYENMILEDNTKNYIVPLVKFVEIMIVDRKDDESFDYIRGCFV